MQARLCEWHPNYKAIRKPKSCQDCWKAYDKLHPGWWEAERECKLNGINARPEAGKK